MTETIAYETKQKASPLEERVFALERRLELALQLIGTISGALLDFDDALSAEAIERPES